MRCVKEKNYRYISIFLSLLFCLSFFFSPNINGKEDVALSAEELFSAVESEYISLPATHNYEESIDMLYNPERGRSFSGGGQLSATKSQSFWDEWTLGQDMKNYDVGYVGLRFGLEAFSDNGPVAVEDGVLNGNSGKVVAYHGKDQLITDVALNSLRDIFQKCRNVGQVAVVAFSYNVHGKGAMFYYDSQSGEVSFTDEENTNGTFRNTYVYAEPSAGRSLVEAHIAQLGEVITEYSDVIMAVETRMVGPWGEQHSTPMANDKYTYHFLTNAWLDATPDDVSVLLRRPSYFLHWFNNEYNHSITESNITDTISYIEKYGIRAKRVGIYNDGYLGSDSDLGTWNGNNRAEINAWLDYQAEHTYYGGEFSGNIPSITDEYQKQFHQMENVEPESFLSHITYVNGHGDYGPMKLWKSQTYTGSDEVYSGKVNEYHYYENHLGYRYVLRSFSYKENNASIDLKFHIENVGFGNLVKEKVAEIILKNEEKVLVFATDIDMRMLKSQEMKEYHVKIFPEEKDAFSIGDYEVFFRIRQELKGDGEMRSIQLANENIYDAELESNHLGNITIVEKPKYFIGIDTEITNGEINFTENSFYQEETVSFTLSPSFGFTLREGSLKITSGGQNISFSEESGTYTFIMPASNVDISAEFYVEISRTEIIIGIILLTIAIGMLIFLLFLTKEKKKKKKTLFY